MSNERFVDRYEALWRKEEEDLARAIELLKDLASTDLVTQINNSLHPPERPSLTKRISNFKSSLSISFSEFKGSIFSSRKPNKIKPAENTASKESPVDAYSTHPILLAAAVIEKYNNKQIKQPEDIIVFFVKHTEKDPTQMIISEYGKELRARLSYIAEKCDLENYDSRVKPLKSPSPFELDGISIASSTEDEPEFPSTRLSENSRAARRKFLNTPTPEEGKLSSPLDVNTSNSTHLDSDTDSPESPDSGRKSPQTPPTGRKYL